MIAASPAKGCGSSCLRSCAGEEGSSWPSGPPVMRAGGCDDHILSDGRLHLSPFPPAPKEQVRSIGHDAHLHLHSEVVRWNSDIGAVKGDRVSGIGDNRNGYKVDVADAAACRIEINPSDTRKINLRPG